MAADGLGPLPKGWAAYLDDDTGRWYYYNHETGNSTWARSAVTAIGIALDTRTLLAGNPSRVGHEHPSSELTDDQFQADPFRALWAAAGSCCTAFRMQEQPFKERWDLGD